MKIDDFIKNSIRILINSTAFLYLIHGYASDGEETKIVDAYVTDNSVGETPKNVNVIVVPANTRGAAKSTDVAA